MIRRREFITLLGGVAAWPLAARAQQPERMRRIGVLMSQASGDPVGQARNVAFLQGLQELGWTIGRNVHIDYRWAPEDVGRGSLRSATELVALAPDVILATGGIGVEPLRDAALALGSGQLGAIQALAPSVGVELRPVGVGDASEIERAVTAFAQAANNGGLIVTASAPAIKHRDLIIALATRHRLPAVYSARFFVTGGGLISYGPDGIEPYRQAAGYVDRILKGEKPGNLPVQGPTKYELVINLKAAKALDLDIPPTLLARADEVIE